MTTCITFNPSEQILFDYLKEKGEELAQQEIRDFGLNGYEEDSEIIQLANDYLSGIESDRAESKHCQKYSYLYEQ